MSGPPGGSNGPQDGFMNNTRVTAPSEAIAVLSAAFALGILLHAGLSSSATLLHSHRTKTLLLHRLRLLLLLIHIAVSLFALIQFVVLLLLNPTSCQVAVTSATIFEQLIRCGILVLLIVKVLERSNVGGKRRNWEWWLLVAGLGIARGGIAVLVTGFQRTEFAPVCFARPGMGGWPVRAQVVVDGVAILYLLLRISMLYGVFSSGDPNTVVKEGSVRGQAMGMFLIALATGGWWAGSIPHVLGMGNLAVRVFPLVGTLLILLAMLRLFPNIVFLASHGGIRGSNDGGLGKSMSMRRLDSISPEPEVQSRGNTAGTGAGRGRDGTGYSPNGSPVVTPRPGDIESNKASKKAAGDSERRYSGFVFGSIIGAPSAPNTASVVPGPSSGWALMKDSNNQQGSNSTSSNNNSMRKTLTSMWGAGAARGIQSFFPGQQQQQQQQSQAQQLQRNPSISGPISGPIPGPISGPVKIGLPSHPQGGPGRMQMKTIDLATAASQERRRIDAEFRRAEEKRLANENLSRNPSNRSIPPTAVQDIRTMERTTSVKRKAISRKGSLSQEVPEQMPQQPQQQQAQNESHFSTYTYTTSTTDSTYAPTLHSESQSFIPQALQMAPPVPLPRRLDTAARSTALDVAIPSPELLNNRSPGTAERQETVLFINQIIYNDPELVKSLISPAPYTGGYQSAFIQGLSSSRSTGSTGSLKRRNSPKKSAARAPTDSPVIPSRTLTPIMNRKKSLIGVRRPRTLFPASGSPELKALYLNRPLSSHSHKSKSNPMNGPPVSSPPNAPLPPVPARDPKVTEVAVSEKMKSARALERASVLSNASYMSGTSYASSEDIDVTKFPIPPAPRPKSQRKLSTVAGNIDNSSILQRNASTASQSTTSTLSRNTSTSSYRHNSMLSRNPSIVSQATTIPSRNTSTSSKYNTINRLPPAVPEKSAKRLSAMLQQQVAMAGSREEAGYATAKAWVKSVSAQAALVDIPQRHGSKGELAPVTKETESDSETDIDDEPGSWEKNDDTLLQPASRAITPLPAIAMLPSAMTPEVSYDSEFDDEQGDSDRTQSEVEELTDDDYTSGEEYSTNKHRPTSIYDGESDSGHQEDQSPVRVVNHDNRDSQEFAHLQQVEQNLSEKMDRLMLEAVASPQGFAAPRLMHFKLGDTIPTFSQDTRRKYGTKRKPPPSPIGWLLRAKMAAEAPKPQVKEDEDIEPEDEYDGDGIEESEVSEEEDVTEEVVHAMERGRPEIRVAHRNIQDHLTMLAGRDSGELDLSDLIKRLPSVKDRRRLAESRVRDSLSVPDGRNSLLDKLEMEMSMQENEWMSQRRQLRGTSAATFITEEETSGQSTAQVSPTSTSPVTRGRQPAVLGTYAGPISRLSSRISQTFQSRDGARPISILSNATSTSNNNSRTSGTTSTTSSLTATGGVLTNWQRQLAQAQLEYVENAPTLWNRNGLAAPIEERLVLKSQGSPGTTTTHTFTGSELECDEDISPMVLPESRRSLYRNANANFMFSRNNTLDEYEPNTASSSGSTVFETDDVEVEELEQSHMVAMAQEYEYESATEREFPHAEEDVDYALSPLPATVYCPTPSVLSELSWEQEFTESARNSVVPSSPPLVNGGIGMLWTPPAPSSTVIFELSGAATLWTGIRTDQEWNVVITQSLRRYRDPRAQTSAAVEGEKVKSLELWNHPKAYEQREKAKRWTRPRLWMSMGKGLWPEGRLASVSAATRLVGLWRDAPTRPLKEEIDQLEVRVRHRAEESEISSVSGGLWTERSEENVVVRGAGKEWLWECSKGKSSASMQGPAEIAQEGMVSLRSNMRLDMSCVGGPQVAVVEVDTPARRYSIPDEEVENRTNITIMISSPMPSARPKLGLEESGDERCVSESEYEEDDESDLEDILGRFSPVFRGNGMSSEYSWDMGTSSQLSDDDESDDAFEYDSVPQIRSLLWKENKVCTGEHHLWTPPAAAGATTNIGISTSTSTSANSIISAGLWRKETASRTTSLQPITLSAKASAVVRKSDAPSEELARVSGGLWGTPRVQLWQQKRVQSWRLVQRPSSKTLWKRTTLTKSRDDHCHLTPAPRPASTRTKRRISGTPLASSDKNVDAAGVEFTVAAGHALWSAGNRLKHYQAGLQTEDGMVGELLWKGPTEISAALALALDSDGRSATANICKEENTTHITNTLSTTTTTTTTTTTSSSTIFNNNAAVQAKPSTAGTPLVPSRTIGGHAGGWAAETTKPTPRPSTIFKQTSAPLNSSHNSARSMAISLWQKQPPATTVNTSLVAIELESSDTPISLWTRERASRSTAKRPERITPIKRYYDDTPVQKAVGSLWQKQEKVEVVEVNRIMTAEQPVAKVASAATVQKSNSTNPITITITNSKASSLLWQFTAPEQEQDAENAPMWSKHTAKRNTTALPATHNVVLRKFTASPTLPAPAVGTLWRKQQPRLWHREVGKEKWRLPSTPTKETALWSRDVRGSGRQTEMVPGESLRKGIVRKSVAVQVDGNLWTVEGKMQVGARGQVNWLQVSSVSVKPVSQAPAKMTVKATPQTTSTTTTTAKLWSPSTSVRALPSSKRTTSAPLLAHTPKARKPEPNTALPVMTGPMWTATSVAQSPSKSLWQRPMEAWRRISLQEIERRKAAKLWTPETAKRATSSPVVGVLERKVSVERRTVEVARVGGELWSAKRTASTPPLMQTIGLWGSSPTAITRSRSSTSASSTTSNLSSPSLSSTSSVTEDDLDLDDLETISSPTESSPTSTLLIRRDTNESQRQGVLEGLWQHRQSEMPAEKEPIEGGLWMMQGIPTGERELRKPKLLVLEKPPVGAGEKKKKREMKSVERFGKDQTLWSATAPSSSPTETTTATTVEVAIHPPAATSTPTSTPTTANATLATPNNPFATRLRIPSLRKKLRPVSARGPNGSMSDVSESEEGEVKKKVAVRGKMPAALASPGEGWLRRKGIA